MKRTFDFGKVDLIGTGKRYPVKVTCELTTKGGRAKLRLNPYTKCYEETGEFTPTYVEFTASGMIGACCGGQCLDEINKHRNDMTPEARDVWDEIYHWWRMYHLNGMHAGTPEQEQAVRDWRLAGNGHRYDYKDVCEMLKTQGLYEVNYTGKSVGRYYNNEPYKYGTGWLVQDIDGADLIKIEHLLSC